MALELVNIPVVGYVSVERHEPARRVVEANYPNVVHYHDVKEIGDKEVRDWVSKFSQVSLVLIGAGPPCQGVSGLNADRKGALKDERSCLFSEVPRIRDAVKEGFNWCPVYVLMESVASMDKQDREVMSEGIDAEPIRCDAGTLTWCHRPRLYWCDWEILEGEGYTVKPGSPAGPRELKRPFQPSLRPGPGQAQGESRRECSSAPRRSWNAGGRTSTGFRPISTVSRTALSTNTVSIVSRMSLKGNSCWGFLSTIRLDVFQRQKGKVKSMWTAD